MRMNSPNFRIFFRSCFGMERTNTPPKKRLYSGTADSPILVPDSPEPAKKAPPSLSSTPTPPVTPDPVPPAFKERRSLRDPNTHPTSTSTNKIHAAYSPAKVPTPPVSAPSSPGPRARSQSIAPTSSPLLLGGSSRESSVSPARSNKSPARFSDSPKVTKNSYYGNHSNSSTQGATITDAHAPPRANALSNPYIRPTPIGLQRPIPKKKMEWEEHVVIPTKTTSSGKVKVIQRKAKNVPLSEMFSDSEAFDDPPEDPMEKHWNSYLAPTPTPGQVAFEAQMQKIRAERAAAEFKAKNPPKVYRK